MNSTPVNGLTLYYDDEGAYALTLVKEACQQAVLLVQTNWQLVPPEECRGYIMTSLQQYLSHAPPAAWRLMLGLTKPFWYSRFETLWDYAGGWEQQFSKRHTFGVKPPHLLQKADRSIGELIFIQEDDINMRVQRNTCHELTHAFSSHLKLPMWFKEGLAMLSVDIFAGKPTVKSDSLYRLNNKIHDNSPGSYRQARVTDPDTLVYQTVRGYWLTRYLQETQPELFPKLLGQRYSHTTLENKVAQACGLDPVVFWREINGKLFAYYKPA
jgi:hypothetical protein